LRTVITEDFHRMHAICYRELANMAARRFGVPGCDGKTEVVALNLFLDHPRVFEFAWAIYSYTASYANISQHWLQRHYARTGHETAANLEAELQSYFAAQGRGDECRLHVYDEPDELVISVLPGSQLRTIACLVGHEVTVNQFRPACEDVLIYDKPRALLSVKVSTPRDREYYVHCFARLILGDEALADHPERDQVYTLQPLQTDGLRWATDGKVIGLEMVKGTMKPHEPGHPVLIVEGDRRDWLEPSRGQLVEAELRFTITEDGREKKVTFNIHPPCITDLVKKRYADEISDYLREKGCCSDE